MPGPQVKLDRPEDLMGQLDGCLADIAEVQLPELTKRIASIRSACEAAQKLAGKLEAWMYSQLT
jgi:hypothetical protein